MSDAAVLVWESIRRAQAAGITARDLRAQTGLSLDDITLAVSSLHQHGLITCIVESIGYRCVARDG